MAEPFAKLYDLGDGVQVLYYLDTAEDYKLVQRTEVDGVAIEINPTFKTPEAAQKALQDACIEQARKFHDGAIQLMNKYIHS